MRLRWVIFLLAIVATLAAGAAYAQQKFAPFMVNGGGVVASSFVCATLCPGGQF